MCLSSSPISAFSSNSLVLIPLFISPFPVPLSQSTFPFHLLFLRNHLFCPIDSNNPTFTFLLFPSTITNICAQIKCLSPSPHFCCFLPSFFSVLQVSLLFFHNLYSFSFNCHSLAQHRYEIKKQKQIASVPTILLVLFNLQYDHNSLCFSR